MTCLITTTVCAEASKRITKVMTEFQSISEQMKLGGKRKKLKWKRQKVPSNTQNTISVAQSMFCTVSVMKTRSGAKTPGFAQEESRGRALGERGALCVILQH